MNNPYLELTAVDRVLEKPLAPAVEGKEDCAPELPVQVRSTTAALGAFFFTDSMPLSQARAVL